MSAECFVEDINSRGRLAHAANSLAEIHALLDNRVTEEDIILFLGPEDIREVSQHFCQSEHGVYLHH